MRLRILIPAVMLVAAAACDSPLEVTPTGSIPEATAINDGPSAEAALVGAYASLRSLDYYGETLPTLPELSSDNADFDGTRTENEEADEHRLHADNGFVADMWAAMYDGINRTNEILTKVPDIKGMDDAERNEILGEAYFLRALHYHNLVKLFGGVPIRTQPASSLTDAASVTRASVADVYKQILSDLDQAQQLITNTDDTRRASRGAVFALRSRVLLYQQDWAGAVDAADSVEAMGYSLAPNFSDLFDVDGADTPEDIFRVIFTAQDYNNIGYYYDDDWGIQELAPTVDLMQAFDPNMDPNDVTTYAPTDTRGQWSIQLDGDSPVGEKFRASAGTEDFHVIRLAEVMLNKAEALARQGQLAEAVAEYNPIRVRAKLMPDTLGTTVIDTSNGNVLDSQDEVIARILNERRKELAFEGDRWPDLVRTGLATTVLGISPDMTLYPIPQREVDVTPGLTQNPGY
ncbi:MAG TPA: RagB/SusD family nutrient uptake outer membrane protein [Gemmatimonadaceae bacterium]|nr:RagB/SusD family nutrient uptake outer membrane protein [Gemmatimonadaceae bacterium]